jgi:diacylglycerol kinase family enzyme
MASVFGGIVHREDSPNVGIVSKGTSNVWAKYFSSRGSFRENKVIEGF